MTIALAAVVAALSMAAPAEDDFLKLYAETRRFAAGRPVAAKATPDGKAVLFLRAKAKSPELSLYSFDVATGETKELLTPGAILEGAEEKLSAAEKARLERQRVTARGFTSYQLSEDGEKLMVALSGKLYVVARATGAVTPLATGEGAPIDPQLSRDGRAVAYVRDNDVYALDLAAGAGAKEKRVTKGGSEVVTHGLAEFVAQEEMDRYSGFWWSPDGKSIAFEEADHGKLERFAIADPMHPERGAETFFYPRAGKENAKVRLGIAPVAGGATVWVKWDAEKYPYLARVVWPKKGPLTVLVQNRAQTEEVLYAVEPKTGKVKELLTEKDGAWLNLDTRLPVWLEDGSGFFWVTERNGGPELQLRNADGSLNGLWLKADAGYLWWVGFDEKSRTAWFLGGPDPTQTLLYRVREGSLPERAPTLAGDAGATELASLAKDGSLYVATSQTLEWMGRTAVFSADGKKLGELPSVAIESPLAVNGEVREVGPDKLRALVLRPKSFKKGAKLPVLLSVYGGPGHRVVNQAMGGVLIDQWFAEQGFIVVRIDGHGTPGRGRAWERAIKGDFSKTVDDQLAGLQQLGKELPELDLARVGVYGWSFGGYLTNLLVMQRPDVFKAAVSGAPVVDFADYDTHYTERYLGMPAENPKGYEASNVLTYAGKLNRPLLIIHGTSDDNVYFFHSLKLSDALFKAGKKHELLPLSGFTHMVPDPVVTQRLEQRIAQFFRENL